MSFDFDDETVEASLSLVRETSEELAVLVLSGPSAGANLIVRQERLLIGRSGQADLEIADSCVSREHAVIERISSGDYQIRDLESTFGLIIDGARSQSAVLHEGTRVQLSPQTELRVRFQDHRETQILGQLREAVVTDPLTGVANRRYLMRRVEEDVSFAARHKLPLSLLALDVDEFKLVNDTYGHIGGDEYLRALSVAIRTIIRNEDVLGRYGGDEFMVLCRGLAENDALRFGNRLLSALSKRRVQINGTDLPFRISIGVAQYVSGTSGPEDVMTLLSRADAALYRSKRCGRSQVSAWSMVDEASHGNTDDFVTAAKTDDLDLRHPKTVR